MLRDDLDLVSITIAARLLGKSISTLKRLETVDGQWCHLARGSLRVFRTSPRGERRYSKREIQRLLRKA